MLVKSCICNLLWSFTFKAIYELLIILFPDNEETAGPLEPDETLKLEFLFVDAVSYEVIRLCSWNWD